MYRRRSPRRGDCPLALCCMAFGLGVLLALCGELRTALVFAAIGLVILGFRCRRELPSLAKRRSHCMKVVVYRSPRLLSGLLRALFHIRREPELP